MDQGGGDPFAGQVPIFFNQGFNKVTNILLIIAIYILLSRYNRFVFIL